MTACLRLHTDLDFFGAILPQEDGSRRWIDSPFLRAIRQSRLESVLRFLDEVNGIPRLHRTILLGSIISLPSRSWLFNLFSESKFG